MTTVYSNTRRLILVNHSTVYTYIKTTGCKLILYTFYLTIKVWGKCSF